MFRLEQNFENSCIILPILLFPGCISRKIASSGKVRPGNQALKREHFILNAKCNSLGGKLLNIMQLSSQQEFSNKW